MTREEIVAALDGGRYKARLEALGPERATTAQKREAIGRFDRLEQGIDPTAASAGQLKIMNAVLNARQRDVAGYVALLTARPPEIRVGLLKALQFSPFPQEVAGAIRARLTTDPSPQVRHQAATALGTVGDASDADALMEALVRPYTPEPNPSAENIEGAWRQRYRRVVLGQPADPRAGAAHALGKLKNPATLPSLLLRLDDPSFECRSAALDAVVAFGDPETVPALEALLADAGRTTDDDRKWRAQLTAGLEALRGESRRPRR